MKIEKRAQSFTYQASSMYGLAVWTMIRNYVTDSKNIMSSLIDKSLTSECFTWVLRHSVAFYHARMSAVFLFV